MTEAPPTDREPRQLAHRVRRVPLLVHRYVGLVLALFLVIAGLTGTVLVFREELDEGLNPELFFVGSEGSNEPLDPFAVARRTLPLQEGGVGWDVRFNLKEGKTVEVWRATEQETYVQRFVDPRTGKLVGEREWGNIGEGLRNLVPFIYRLHYSLALGEVGTVLFGVIALFWSLDCFVGAYLTLPARGPRDAKPGGPVLWLRRWLPAWLVRSNSWYAWSFTWHRASGLWLWGLLFVFAWSAVGLNLWPVYRPVMAATLGMQDTTHDRLPTLAPPFAPSPLAPERAYQLAKEYMEGELADRGAHVQQEQSLTYAPEHAAIVYRVQSSLDIQDRYPRTEVYLDSTTGARLGFDAPTGQAAGNTVTQWLYALHMGTVGGIAYRLLIAVVGVLVAVLSVTGVVIWWRKVQKRRPAPRPASRHAVPSSAHAGLARVDDARLDS